MQQTPIRQLLENWRAACNVARPFVNFIPVRLTVRRPESL
jgi:hypothetical protein